tara:strand:+ start:298 stop:501 length:204 start_codon:yes stop_codon:yes gene_type:complete
MKRKNRNYLILAIIDFIVFVFYIGKEVNPLSYVSRVDPTPISLTTYLILTGFLGLLAIINFFFEGEV